METNSVLSQIERYDEQSRSREAWLVDHDVAMARADLEDWLDYGLGLLTSIKRLEDRYKSQFASGERAFDRSKIELIDELYMHWFAPCNHLLQITEEFASAGFPLKNARDFADACETSHISGFDSISLKASDCEYQRSGGKPLIGVMNELRRRVG